MVFTMMLTVAFNSLVAMLKVFCISAVGIYIAKRPVDSPHMPSSMVKSIAKLSNSVLLPCLITSSLGVALTPSLLATLSTLILFACIVNIVSYISFLGVTQFIKISDEGLLRSLAIASSSPNAISLPIIVIQTLCEQNLVNKDFASSEVCFSQATSMLFVYSIGWHLIFWSFGFPELKRVKEKEKALNVIHLLQNLRWKTLVHDLREWCYQVLLSTSMVAIYIGIIIAMIPALQAALFQDITILRPIGSTIITLGQPVVCVNSLVMAASLAQVDISSLLQKIEKFKRKFANSYLPIERNIFGDEAVIADVRCGMEGNSSSRVDVHTVSNPIIVNFRGTDYQSGGNSNNTMSDNRGLESSRNINDNGTNNSGCDNSCSMKITNNSHKQSEDVYDTDKGNENQDLQDSLLSDSHQVDIRENLEQTPITKEGNDSELDKNEAENNTEFPVFEIEAEDGVMECKSTQATGDIPSMNAVIIHTLCRLIIPPAVIIILISIFRSANWFNFQDKSDPRMLLMQLVICIDSSAPSAQIIIVTLNQLELIKEARQLSYLYVFQYLFSIVTITIWATVAILTFY